MPRQNNTAQPFEGVIASPNPTIDDSNSATGDAIKVESEPVQPAATTTAAPMKTTKSKPKRCRTRPRT